MNLLRCTKNKTNDSVGESKSILFNSLFLFPSTNEGFGLPILEASKYGKVSLFIIAMHLQKQQLIRMNNLCGCNMSDPLNFLKSLNGFASLATES